MILNLQEYRNNNEVKHEAEKIRIGYEEYTNYEIYKKIGMGKEALKQIFSWLNNEIKLNLNKEDILEVMEKKDIPIEMENILNTLQSNILQRDNLGDLEKYEEVNEVVDEENSVDEILQLTLPL